MPMIDAFTPDQFNLVTMTAAVNKVPFAPGYIGGRGLFTSEGVSTDTVAIEERNGVLALVQSKPRGSPRGARARERRKLRTFTIPHLPVDDYIRAAELRGVREFGTQDQAVALETIRDRRLASMRADLDLTHENHALGAVQGRLLDADGSVIYDMFEEFDVAAQDEFDFALNVTTEGSLIKKCQAAKRIVIGALDNQQPGEIEALCGDNFFDALVSNVDAREFYRRAAQARLAEAPVYDSFRFAGITWTNYRGAGDVAINTDKCRIYPLGVPGMFIRRFAPADYFDTVNTLGLPFYSKAVADDWDTQIDVSIESNPLYLCTRPRALLQGKKQ